MKYIEEDNQFVYYSIELNNFPIRVSKNKITGEILFNMDDFAQAAGYNSLSEFLLSNKHLADIFLDGFNNGEVVIVD